MTLYNSAWFTARQHYRPWIARAANALVSVEGTFESVLDLGAGDGWFVHCLGGGTAVEISADALLVMPADVHGTVHDLREPLDLGHTFGLVLCLEVAEHLPAATADTLCDTIARHTARRLIFSAARPGQGGVGHLNCQAPAYWIDKLEARGLIYQLARTMALRQAWREALDGHMPWLSRNVLSFERPAPREEWL